MLTSGTRFCIIIAAVSTPDLPHSRPRFGILKRFSLVAFVLFLVFVGSRPLWQVVAEWRVRHHLEHARSAMTLSAWVPAAAALADARGILPAHAEVLRMTATFLDETNSDPHLLLQTLRQLEQAGHAEEGDALMHIRALIAAQRHEEARKEFETLKPVQRGLPDALLIEARLLRDEGNEKAAHERALRAHAMRPDDADAALALAISQSWNTPYEVQSAAIKRLWNMAEGHTPAALGAIQHLASQPYVTLPQAERLLLLAEAHALCRPATRLATVSAILRKAPERRAAMLDAEVARYRGSKIGDLTQAAFWLAAETEHGRLLEICPLRLALESQDLFPIVALSLAQQQKWQELRRLLTEERVPAAKVRINVWLAWADGFLQPDLKNARLQLESAITQARKTTNREVIMSAAHVAEIHGMWDLALECYAFCAVSGTGTELPLLEKAFVIARQQADAHGMLVIAHRLHEVRPTSAVFAERVSYLGLLLGLEMEAILPLLKPGAQAGSPSMRALLAALAAHRFQDVAAVRAALVGVTEPAIFQPGERAVYAGLLALTGQTAAGFQIAEKIPEPLLLEAEKRFWKLAK